MSRPLTIPNWFHASSSCSDEAVTEHQVNMTHLHVLDQPMVTITVPLIHGRRNCSFNVMDELGNMQNIDTGQSKCMGFICIGIIMYCTVKYIHSAVYIFSYTCMYRIYKYEFKTILDRFHHFIGITYVYM